LKCIIAGGRTFKDFDEVCTAMALLEPQPTTIISGGAKGADALGEEWARQRNIPVERYEADWGGIYGRAAGPLRNTKMAEAGDVLVAFWDGQSRGTKDMITKAMRAGLITIVWPTNRKVSL
jgi:hypothetical protein